jgi:hypothetical protein
MWIILFTLTIFFLNAENKKMFNNRVLKFMLLIWIVLLLQSFIFGGFSVALFYKPLMLFLTPYLMFKLIGIKYFKYLFNIIYFFAVFSIPLWLLNNFFPNLLRKLAGFFWQFNWDVEPRSLLFYTVEFSKAASNLNFFRNAGFFHEPGAYSIYLMFAIIINSVFTKEYLSKKNIILMLIMLTTFSTAGYIMLTLFLIVALKDKKMQIGLKPFIIVVMIILTYFLFVNTEFLYKKVSTQYKQQNILLETKVMRGRGRFFAFFSTFNYIKQNPLIGRGAITATQYDVLDEYTATGYGFLDLFLRYGIIIAFIYIYYFMKGMKYLNYIFDNKEWLIFFIIINLGLLTQAFFYHIPFVMLFIFGLTESKRFVHNHNFYFNNEQRKLL